MPDKNHQSDKIILVDTSDKEIGSGEKLQVHKEGKLHRAFSIYIFNSKGKVLIQKRNKAKYHSGGLWSNTCCSHPRAGERMEEAIHRRLQEEMGFDADLQKLFTTIYKVNFSNGLKENEFLHVFAGKHEGAVEPDKEEAEDWKWADALEIQEDIAKNPDKYSYWFNKCFPQVVKVLQNR